MKSLIYLQTNIVLLLLFYASILKGNPINDSYSPDKQHHICISESQKIGDPWRNSHIDKLYSIQLWSKKSLLWSGTTMCQDEIGEIPKVIWSQSAKDALLIHRPNRAEVILCIIRTSEPFFENVLNDDLLNDLSKGMPLETPSFFKRWTRNWKCTGPNTFEGDLVIAKSAQRTIHLKITCDKTKSNVSVINMKTTP